LRRFNDIGFLILSAVVLFSVIFFTDILNMPNIYLVDRNVISFSDGWTWQGDGYQKKFHLPHYFDVGKSEPLIIRNTIPDDLPDGAKIALKSDMQSVEAKIDGETIYAMGHDSGKFLGKDFATFWAVIDIYPEQKGKVIELALFSHAPPSQGYASGIVIASGSGILAHIFLQKGLWNVLSIFIIVLGTILILAYFLTGIYKEKQLGFFYLGTSAIIAGNWFLGESGMLQLFSNNTYYTTKITLLMTLLCPISFSLYIRENLPQRGKNFCDNFLISLFIVNAAVCLFLEYLNILGLRDTFPITLMLIAIFLIYNIVILLLEVYYYKNEKASIELKAILIFIVFAVVELIVFYLNGQKDSSHYLLIGTAIYIVLSIFNQFKGYNERRKIREDKEYFEKMAYTDALTGGNNRAKYVKDLEDITEPEGFAIIQADTDRLKYINDYFGHSHGDIAIIDTHEVLHKNFATIGRVYRIGGDEFSVIVKNADRDEINRIIEQVKKDVDLIAEKRVYDFSMSIGIAEYDASLDEDIHATRVRADHNMYNDKKRLRNTVPRKMPGFKT
jgi:diguanylate cyclase (GGDEF)-like protein